MTGFKPWTSGIGSNRSTNLATTTAQHSIFDLNKARLLPVAIERLYVGDLHGVSCGEGLKLQNPSKIHCGESGDLKQVALRSRILIVPYHSQQNAGLQNAVF